MLGGGGLLGRIDEVQGNEAVTIGHCRRLGGPRHRRSRLIDARLSSVRCENKKEEEEAFDHRTERHVEKEVCPLESILQASHPFLREYSMLP